MLRRLPAQGRPAPERVPAPFLSPGAVGRARASGRGGEGSQPAGHARGKQGQGSSLPRACSWPFPVGGAAGSEEKGLGWEAGAGGRGWGFIKSPAGSSWRLQA